ncbi:Spermatogenesis-Associated Protein 31E1 [Manis pentadactyla]|nr:Spermatogenesis-Associated Protein 31E1 [Manis pentadactyla]
MRTFFWGIPFLHSKSLEANARESGSQQEIRSVSFNGHSSAFPFRFQAIVGPHISPTQPLPQPMAPSQPLHQTAAPSQVLPQPAAPSQVVPQPVARSKPLYQIAVPSQVLPQPVAPSQHLYQPVAPSQPLYQPVTPSQVLPQPAAPSQHNLECHSVEKQRESEQKTLPPMVKKAQVFSPASRPPAQTSTCVSVGRMWHSEMAVRAHRASLEMSPGAATASSESGGESGGWAAGVPHCRITVLEGSTGSPSSSANEDPGSVVAEEASAWKVTLKSSVPANSQITNVDLRRSGTPGTNKIPTLPSVKGVIQDPEEPRLHAQHSDSELCEKVASGKQPADSGPAELLQDCDAPAELPGVSCRRRFGFSELSVQLAEHINWGHISCACVR